MSHYSGCHKASRFKEQLLERLVQAIDVIDNPKKIQKTACIGTLL
jgi:hypothetical protein